MSQNEEVKKIIERLISIMGFSGEIETRVLQDETFVVNIQTQEAGLLIGPGGQSLVAFQHLARVVAKKQLPNFVPFLIDVNNYRFNRLALLEDMAKDIGQQVRLEHRAVELAPMSAFERRVVHLAIKEIPGVESESQGDGQSRHVVVRPVSQNV